jgi:hypothetical protein
LLPHHRDDLGVARQREEPLVGRDQQRNAVEREQRSGVALATAAGREGVEVLADHWLTSSLSTITDHTA